MYFSTENLLRVNSVLMNYKIRHSKNRPAARPVMYSHALPNRFSHYYLWWLKNGKTWSGHARLHARVAMEEGLPQCVVSQSIGQSRSLDDYCYLLDSGFVRIGSQVLCSYSYQANEELVIPWMYSREPCQWRWFAKVFFHGWFPIYGIYFKQWFIPYPLWESFTSSTVPL